MAIVIPAGHVITPTEWSLLLSFGQPLYVRKTVDESVNNSSTLQDDDVLLLAVEASATYELTSLLIYTSGTSEDLKVGWSGPASATLDWIMNGADLADTDSTAQTVFSPLAIGGTGTSAGDTGGAATSRVCYPYGLLRTSVTAGTLTMRFAQNSAGAGTSATIKAGSYISLRRLT